MAYFAIAVSGLITISFAGSFVLWILTVMGVVKDKKSEPRGFTVELRQSDETTSA